MLANPGAIPIQKSILWRHAPMVHFVGIIIATAAAIIASQALISGSFTLISEAIRH